MRYQAALHSDNGRLYARERLIGVSGGSRKRVSRARGKPKLSKAPTDTTVSYSTSSTFTVRPESRCAREASMKGSRSPSSTSDGVPEVYPVRKSLTI